MHGCLTALSSKPGMVAARLLASTVLVTAVACTGSIARPGEPGGSGGASGASGSGLLPRGGGGVGETSGPSSGRGGPATTGSDVGGPRPLLRLSRRQLGNAIRDLLGAAPASVDDLPSDVLTSSGFAYGGSLSTVDVRALIEVVDQASTDAMKRVDTLAPCPAGRSASDCARAFITSFGRRAFRRPLEPAEVDDLSAYYSKTRDTLAYDHAHAVRAVTTAMLLSPDFLFHWEVAPSATVMPGKAIPLTSHQLASRLSFWLWNSIPDARLSAAADDGSLANDETLTSETKRLLADPRAKDGIGDFHVQWLGVDDVATLTKSKEAYPSVSPAVLSTIQSETSAYADDLFRGSGDGKLASLLTSRASFVDGSLAAIYGVSAPNGATSDKLGKAMLSGPRAGLLTRAAFLAKYATASGSHPVRRGHLVWSNVVCGALPPMPDQVPEPRPPAANLSTRERYAEHGQLACARGCHSIMDPLGFAFEEFDGLGALRRTDGGKPVDASGAVTLPSGARVDFSDAGSLMDALAKTDDVRSCVTRTWARYALGRAEIDGDEAALERAFSRFRDTDFDLRELIVALAQSKSFRNRIVSEGEGQP